MFTGLIEGIGTVVSLQRGGADWTLGVAAPFDLAGVSLGDSVAVNGVCLTVIAKDAIHFQVQVSRATLAVSTMTSVRVGQKVNLERAMVLGGRLDGHLVQGHVDTVGDVERLLPQGRSVALWFRVPGAFGRYIVPKGSVAIDGVSLTVNEVVDSSGALTRFSVNIIPHTGHKTTLSSLVAGSSVNVETDLLGRYVERLLTVRGQGETVARIDEAYLRERGF